MEAKCVIYKAAKDHVKWAILAPSGAFKDAQIFDCKIEPGACPFCAQAVVVELPPPLKNAQPDGTTHVCHPALGGCNHGFAKQAASNKKPRRTLREASTGKKL